jgi:hypothetical protein
MSALAVRSSTSNHFDAALQTHCAVLSLAAGAR